MLCKKSGILLTRPLRRRDAPCKSPFPSSLPLLTHFPQLVGALRATLRLTSPHRLHPPSILRLSPVLFPHSTPLLPHRTFSLKFFPKVTQTPSPTNVANIARLESDANGYPYDIAKQIQLFRALADTKVKAGYNLIISRWERMCAFVSLFSSSFFLEGGLSLSGGRTLLHRYYARIRLLSYTSQHCVKLVYNNPSKQLFAHESPSSPSQHHHPPSHLSKPSLPIRPPPPRRPRTKR